MAKIIGLTGGIGSGKTTIANLFKELGVPVYISDLRAKSIMETQDVIDKVSNLLGDQVLIEGKLNRAEIAKIVFSDSDKLQMLNSIIHPVVKTDFLIWMKQNDSVPYIIKESAVLFENGLEKDCDAVILVTAPIDVRVDRVIDRDNVSKKEVYKRINNQWSDERKLNLSNFVIENIDINIVKEQVKKIHQSIINS